MSEAEWRQEGSQPGLDVRAGPLSVRGPEAGGGLLMAHSEAESGRGWTLKASSGRLRSWGFFPRGIREHWKCWTVTNSG